MIKIYKNKILSFVNGPVYCDTAVHGVEEFFEPELALFKFLFHLFACRDICKEYGKTDHIAFFVNDGVVNVLVPAAFEFSVPVFLDKSK